MNPGRARRGVLPAHPGAAVRHRDGPRVVTPSALRLRGAKLKHCAVHVSRTCNDCFGPTASVRSSGRHEHVLIEALSVPRHFRRPQNHGFRSVWEFHIQVVHPVAANHSWRLSFAAGIAAGVGVPEWRGSVAPIGWPPRNRGAATGGCHSVREDEGMNPCGCFWILSHTHSTLIPCVRRTSYTIG